MFNYVWPDLDIIVSDLNGCVKMILFYANKATVSLKQTFSTTVVQLPVRHITYYQIVPFMLQTNLMNVYQLLVCKHLIYVNINVLMIAYVKTMFQ